ncbi:MAG: HAMP domain-containing sensor histidine kinase [Sediminibacterium sp.]
MSNLYTGLSKLRLLRKNYSLKFLFVAFLGIHIPLITIVILIVTNNFIFNQTYVLIAVLAATLGASIITLYFLNKLLWPLREAKDALGNYLADKKMPALPIHFQDEAGQLLKELQHTIEHLDYLIGEKKDVITILSHDIRTPFNQILGLSGMILLETDRNAINQHAVTMKEVCVKNLMVLNDILKLLKTDHLDENDHTEVELNEMIAMVKHHLSPTSKSKSIQVIIDTSQPVQVLANKVLLAEAFTNVLSNAIKFSFPGSEIHVKIEEIDGAAIVRVRDYGIGITEEDKGKIFKRFTSVGKTGTAGEHSSGVGLYLSRRIITKNKGHLNVFSDGKGQGSTFTITLPSLAVHSPVKKKSFAIYESH